MNPFIGPAERTDCRLHPLDHQISHPSLAASGPAAYRALLAGPGQRLIQRAYHNINPFFPP
jgi:hypothetical protein